MESERWSLAEKDCCVGHKLDHWSSIYVGLEMG